MKEKRSFKLPKEYQARAYTSTGGTAGARYITAYASLFNVESRLIGEFVSIDGINYNYQEFIETIAPTAFDDAIKVSDNVVHDEDHDLTRVISRLTAGNLALLVDDVGLKYTSTLPPESESTTLQNDTYKNVRQLNAPESSFMFELDPDDPTSNTFEWKDGVLYRIINKIAMLYDVATCNYNGAYNTGEAQARQRFTRALPIRADVVPEPPKPAAEPAPAPVPAPVLNETELIKEEIENLRTEIEYLSI